MVRIQRYAKGVDDTPHLEVSTWLQVDDGDPRGVVLDGHEGLWAAQSVAGALIDTSALFTPAAVDPVTGVVVDPGGQPTTPEGLSALFTAPLRAGLVEIGRTEFETLWPPDGRNEDDESPDESPSRDDKD